MIIQPYWHLGTWVFDDDQAGLVKEAFVAGADDMLTKLTEHLEIPDARSGFRLIFSGAAFPGHQVKATWIREEIPGEPEGGNWYAATIDGEAMEGWLCPALFKYFQDAPKEIYIQAKQRAD